MKSPKQLRSEIQALQSGVETIHHILRNKVHDTREPTWGIGRDCTRTAETLASILKTQIIPDHYKVAVVGRFKAGKSSFVNELLGARLAGEDTNPETAAVTTFSHGDSVKALIRFIDAASWEKLRRLYREDSKHIDAHRMKVWMSFMDKARKNADEAPVEKFDLPLLEKSYVKQGGFSIQIPLEEPCDRKAQIAFRRRLKEFTTARRPHHCLVESIEITSPSPLLDEGVLLIDTPGLDDTERFRVTLTEKAVEDVDAVLFLTQSGSAYGQSEKDFMLTLLRRGTVKQLIFVITQVDKTYQQHLSMAKSNDEDPDSIRQRIQYEEARIRDEIEATLKELDSEDSPAMRRYREQLGIVGLVFTSAQNHREWVDGNHIAHGIHPEDPGGIERMKSQLLQLLSTESRLALVSYNIATGTKTALDNLLSIIDNRRAALRNIKDKEVAEQRLANFRGEFAITREEFKDAVESELDLLRKNILHTNSNNTYYIENIGLLAELELADFEINDVGKHWKSRRSGHWGYMHQLQRRVANRIFPRVQQLLSNITNQFASYLERLDKHLTLLSQSSEELSQKFDLGASLPFDLKKTLAGSLENSLETANELIASEEQKIISLLDDFVSEEVSENISAARGKVSDIFGRGTTYLQSHEVRDFYSKVKRLLQAALATHLHQRSNAFGNFLTANAAALPRNILAEVDITIRSAEQDIKAAATARVGGDRESFERDAEFFSSEIQKVHALCSPFLDIENGINQNQTVEKSTDPVLPENPKNLSQQLWINQSTGKDWIDEIQDDAVTSVMRFSLRDGDTGWPFSRLFPAKLLVGCTRIALIDPYLAQPHQIRNLKEFLISVAEAAKPKEITIVTSDTWVMGGNTSTNIIEQVEKDLFQSFGTNLSVFIDNNIHDRYIVCDHGILFKLGRGLDIYKPAVGLATHRPANRRVRRTDIDIFAVDQWSKCHIS
jgi:predicted GTPase